MKLLIGLGNPGEKYDKTRHNIGFMALDYLWNRVSGDKLKQKFESLYGEVNNNGEKFLFVFPQTFMNNSGQSVRKWVDFYNLDLEDIYVFYDDMDIPFGDFRLKLGGSAGGHNGIKSMIAHLGTQDFQRVRLGIDRQPGSTVDYVLGRFSKHQLGILENETFPKVFDLYQDMQSQRFNLLMNTYNTKAK